MKRFLVAIAGALLVAPVARAESEFSVVLQGGASRYTQSLSGNAADTGAAYGARLGMMPTPMLGGELGYLGTLNNINADSSIGRASSTLHANEGYVDARLNILPGELTPYVFGGYGVTWVSGGGASGIPNRSASTLPFGGGLDYSFGQFKLGARFQYNYLFDKIYTGNSGGVVTSVSADKGGNADFYAVSIDLGASFR
jgi:hypothetical protein